MGEVEYYPYDSNVTFFRLINVRHTVRQVIRADSIKANTPMKVGQHEL